MPEISLQHIIGTVALIGLVISTGLFYTLFTTSVQADNKQQELKQISQNVALNIEEMINIVKFETRNSENSNYTVKVIDLPSSVGGEPYEIQLLSGTQLQVHSFLANQVSISANSTIPFNSAGTSLSLNTTSTVYQIQVGADNTTIKCSGMVYGKSGIAIWAYPVWSDQTGNAPSSVTVGLGWVVEQS